MTTRTLIHQARVIDPLSQLDRIASVWVESGVVQAIGSEQELLSGIEAADNAAGTPEQTEHIDAQGMILAPGLVDLYSQSGEPGHESRETWLSLLAAAAAGGVTRVGILPTTVPVVDSPAQVAQVVSAQRSGWPQILPWAAMTQGAKGEQLSALAELAETKAVGFCDGLPLNQAMLVRRLLEYAQPLQKPIALWCCDRNITQQGVVRDGIDALKLGFSGVPAMAETMPLAALLECIAEVLTPVHIMRVSTARGVALIQAAKAQGLPITASVTWHHLLLSTQDLATYNPHLRLDPPLGTPSDQQALIAGLEDGTLDAIAIDHAAYTYEAKQVAFAQAPPGAIGLELALPLLWQHFVQSQRWSPMQLWRYLSSQPAHCLNLSAPQIAVQQPAEMVLFDPEPAWQISATNLKSQSDNTPWLGQTIAGQVVRLWVP
jgi:dihydroorotase